MQTALEKARATYEAALLAEAKAEGKVGSFVKGEAAKIGEHVPPRVRKIFGVIELDSPIIIALCFVCTAVHLVTSVFYDDFTRSYFACHPFRWTQLFVSGHGHGTTPTMVWWRLVGHALGHGSWQHLSGNISLILLVGPPCEKDYGSRMLLKILFWTAAVTGVCHNAIGPGNALLMGASGVAFALILLNSLLNVHDGRLPATFLLTCAIWLSSELGGFFSNLLARSKDGDGGDGVSRRTISNAPPHGGHVSFPGQLVSSKLPSCPSSSIVYRYSEKYSLPSAALQYLNSINSSALPMIGTEKPVSMWEETPRTIPSATPTEAIWSQALPA